jgi:hypothetical protein
MEEAQHPRRRCSCATMTVHRRLLDQDPLYRSRRERLENITLARKRSRMPGRAGRTIIPVVVHVVYRTLPENISAAQIATQLTVLNQDFSRLNADLDTLPAVWRPLAGDAQIQFLLADQDPAGAASSGITRTATSVTAFREDDAVKSAARGGADAWPADRYLNIWVCQLEGLLGYAQFPGGPAATDGVVIDFRSFGTIGTAEAPFHMGRTATHEVGHWLNLYHIWGDDGMGCTGTDQVDDTPNQAGPNTGNPVFPHVSCDNAPNGDMFVNFMDYVDDRSMVLFTVGQVERMQVALEVMRSSFGVEEATPTPSLGAWLHTDLSVAIGAPEAAGDPVVVTGPDTKLWVFYRGVDQHLHALQLRDEGAGT